MSVSIPPASLQNLRRGAPASDAEVLARAKGVLEASEEDPWVIYKSSFPEGGVGGFPHLQLKPFGEFFDGAKLVVGKGHVYLTGLLHGVEPVCLDMGPRAKFG